MLVRHNKKMTRNIRIKIQSNESIRTSMQNEVRLVVLSLPREAAKNARTRLRVHARCDVFSTPGTPQSIQCIYLGPYRIGGCRTSPASSGALPVEEEALELSS